MTLRRAVKPIDQLVCGDGFCGGSSPSGAESSTPSSAQRTDLPFASHSVIFLHITGPGSVDEWIKLEFGNDGLKFDIFDHYCSICGAYLDEECPANPVKPDVVADALKSCRH